MKYDTEYITTICETGEVFVEVMREAGFDFTKYYLDQEDALTFRVNEIWEEEKGGPNIISINLKEIKRTTDTVVFNDEFIAYVKSRKYVFKMCTIEEDL